MQTYTNEVLVKRRANLGKYASLGGFGLLVASVLISLDVRYIAWAYAAMLGGLLLFNIGMLNTRRWGGKLRVDQVLGRSLKGIDDRYRLFNYYLPADHVLLTPTGVFVFEPRLHDGEIHCHGDKWKRRGGRFRLLQSIFGEPLGNPTRDANRDAAAMTKYIAEHAPDVDAQAVPVQGVAVFAHANATLVLEDPTVPVVLSKDLKNFMRRAGGQPKMPPEMYKQLAREFQGKIQSE